MNQLPQTEILSIRIARQIAVEASCDEATVRRFVAGERVRSTSAERIVAALRRLHREDLIPKPYSAL